LKFTLLALVPIALVGCPGDDKSDAGPPMCTLSYLGDPSAAIDLQIVARAADGTSQPIDDGADVALVFPPQGGRVIFVGARATNVDPCYVKLTGALRNTTTDAVRVDVRTVNLTPTGDGKHGAPNDTDISSFANVPTCPNQWSSIDLYDQTYQLELTMEDRQGKKATKTIHVVPRCAEPDREVECRCICKAGYILGQPCTSTDAGSDAGTDAGIDSGVDAAGDADDGG
jgi:hypothetical protein